MTKMSPGVVITPPSPVGRESVAGPTRLEKGLPIDGLYAIAKREGNSKKPWYRVHKWWARRLGSVFRMLILTAFSDLERPLQDLWRRYYADTNLEKIILDPFMGGGTTVVEGLRLGCKVVGVDVNPVAWFVTKKEVDDFDPAMADRVFLGIQSRVGQQIQSFYSTTCNDGHQAQIIHAIWVQNVLCRKCARRSSLFRDYLILDRNGLKVLICPHCRNIFKTNSRQARARCGRCDRNFSIDAGVVKRGTFICPSCGEAETIRHSVTRARRPLPFEMVCIEFYCERCGKGFKRPTPLDIRRYRSVERKWNWARRVLPYPKQKIPVRGRDRKRPLTHGYVYYHQLFNKRQLLGLSLLLKEILGINDQTIREFFLLVLSNALETNNKFCKYESHWGKVSSLFAFPGYHPVERFGENHLWGTRYGRGTFTKCFQKLKRAKFYLNNPYERVYEGRVSQKRTGNRVTAGSTSTFRNLVYDGNNSLLVCKSSEKLKFIPDKSVDAVITDPPYFNTIMYSELSDFFYVWLRLGLEKNYSWFKATNSLKRGEIVLNPEAGMNSKEFIRGLEKVFSECRRVLKDDGLMALTFHHTSSMAWKQLKLALANAGWKITSVSIVRSEGNTGYRRGGITHDACIVARKGEENQPDQPVSRPAYPVIIRNSTLVAKKLKKNNGSLKDVDLFTVVMAHCMVFDNHHDDPFKNPTPLVMAVKKNLLLSARDGANLSPPLRKAKPELGSMTSR